MGVKNVDGQLTGIPVKVFCEHFLHDVRALVPGKTDETYLSGLSCRQGHFKSSIGLENPLRIVVVVDLVKLPDIDDVGLQPTQTVAQLHLGRLRFGFDGGRAHRLWSSA